jgi:hypothetical protein
VTFTDGGAGRLLISLFISDSFGREARQYGGGQLVLTRNYTMPHAYAWRRRSIRSISSPDLLAGRIATACRGRIAAIGPPRLRGWLHTIDPRRPAGCTRR